MNGRTEILIILLLVFSFLKVDAQHINLNSILIFEQYDEYLPNGLLKLDKISEQLLYLMLAKTDSRRIFIDENESSFISGILLDKSEEEIPDSILFAIDKINECLYVFIFPSENGSFHRNYSTEDILAVFVFDSSLTPKFFIGYLNSYAKRVDFFREINGFYETSHDYLQKDIVNNDLNIVNFTSLVSDLIILNTKRYHWEEVNICVNGLFSRLSFQCP